MAGNERKFSSREVFEVLYRRNNLAKDGYYDGCDDHEYNWDDDDDDCYCE